MELNQVIEKTQAKERLDFQDGQALLASKDLLTLARLADQRRAEMVGDDVYFIHNHHINPSNICELRCPLCAFSCDDKDARAYQLNPQEIEAIAYKHRHVSEFHIVGGVHPGYTLEYAIQVITQIRRAAPQAHIQAFTPVEIHHFSRLAQTSYRETLGQLIQAGLGSLPGGGAEVFSPRVRRQIAPKKIPGEVWLEIMRTAHQLGLRSNATLLFGHMETDEEILEHLLALRQLQDETGGFGSFIPLTFHPKNTQISVGEVSGFRILKIYALSRLILDNFPHIKAFWIMLGLRFAQLSLAFGANDLDGTVGEEKITHAAGAETPQFLPPQLFLEMIRETGRRPVQRDTLYRPLRWEWPSCN